MSLWISDLKLLFKQNRFLSRILFLILILLLLYANALLFANESYTKNSIYKDGFEIFPENYSVENTIQTINYGNFSIKGNIELSKANSK